MIRVFAAKNERLVEATMSTKIKAIALDGIFPILPDNQRMNKKIAIREKIAVSLRVIVLKEKGNNATRTNKSKEEILSILFFMS